jgi:hypothetical protein
MARLNIANSRSRSSICSFVRIAQTCFGRSGALIPSQGPGRACREVFGVVHDHFSSVTENDHGGPGIGSD